MSHSKHGESDSAMESMSSHSSTGSRQSSCSSGTSPKLADETDSFIVHSFAPDIPRDSAELSFQGTGGGPLIFKPNGDLDISFNPSFSPRYLVAKHHYRPVQPVTETDGVIPTIPSTQSQTRK